MKQNKAFTPLHPESPVFQNGDDGKIEIKLSGKPRPKGRGVTGFTLLELIISASIFAVIMTTVYTAFHSGVFGVRNIGQTINTYQSARQILERINADLRNSFAFSLNNTRFEGSQNAIQFFTLTDKYSFDNGRIIPEYTIVSYKLENETLMRSSGAGLDALNAHPAVRYEEMAPGVNINFKYGYLPNDTQQIQFKDSWGQAGGPKEDKEKLPDAVCVNLTIKERGNQTFERTVYLSH